MNLRSRVLNRDINSDARRQACGIKPFLLPPPILKPRGDKRGHTKQMRFHLPVWSLLPHHLLLPPAQHGCPKKREVQMLTQALVWIQDLSVRIRAGFSVLLKTEQRKRERERRDLVEIPCRVRRTPRQTVCQINNSPDLLG